MSEEKRCPISPCENPVSSELGRNTICHVHALEFIRRERTGVCMSCENPLPKEEEYNERLCPKCMNVAKTMRFFDTATSLNRN